MSALSKPLAVGERIACYTILAITADAPSGEHRRYSALAECCGREVERSECALMTAQRAAAERCHRCAQQAANPKRRAQYAQGQAFGPVSIVARGEAPQHWLVRWDCCGSVAELSQDYLHNLKKRHDEGRTTRCLPCAIAQSRLLAKEREKPSRKSRRKADLLAAKNWSHPIVRPQIPIPEPLELKPAAAQLPTGIVSAATAWPRPGRASA